MNLYEEGKYVKNATHPEFTSLGALAVGGPFLKGRTMVFKALTDAVTWNDEEILSTLPSEFKDELVQAKYHTASEQVKDGKTGRGIDVTFPMGVQLSVNRWSNSLALKIHMCAQEGGQDGQCGNYDGDSADDQADFLLAKGSDNLFAKLEHKVISKVVAGKVSKKVNIGIVDG